MTTCDQDGGLELFLAYTIGIEATWQRLTGDVHQNHADTATKIEELFVVVRNKQADLADRWRSAYLCEQIFAQVMPKDQLIAEGDRRLFEAKALGMKSAGDIGSRWTAAKNADPVSLAALAAIYETLIDDIHWLYNKRSLDRKLRAAIAKPLFNRTIGTFLFCLFPFLFLVLARAWGYDPLNAVPADFQTSLVGGFFAIAFGALGAIFSRLISFQTRYGTIDYDEAASTFVGRSLNLRQVVGSVGSLIFFLAIFGDLVGGKLFPNVGELLHSTQPPGHNEELAKLTVWSFLAGFSERLVPDFLARTEATAASASQSNE